MHRTYGLLVYKKVEWDEQKNQKIVFYIMNYIGIYWAITKCYVSNKKTVKLQFFYVKELMNKKCKFYDLYIFYTLSQIQKKN